MSRLISLHANFMLPFCAFYFFRELLDLQASFYMIIAIKRFNRCHGNQLPEEHILLVDKYSSVGNKTSQASHPKTLRTVCSVGLKS